MTTIRILTTWIVLMVITVAFGWAQTDTLPRTSVIIIDKQRVLSETLYGRRLASELRQMEQLQVADNKRLLQELELEEASLTKQRSSMNADEFRVLAANFDEKVQLISNQQPIDSDESTAKKVGLLKLVSTLQWSLQSVLA